MRLWPGRKKGSRPLGDYSYEELFEHFDKAPADVMAEFHHRLWRTVFSMALDTARDSGLSDEAALREQATTLTENAFAYFKSEFDKGQSGYGLARFGRTLESVLGDDIFRKNAVRFYTHVPLYYLEDEVQRECLAMVLERGLSDEAFQEVARLRNITVDELKTIVTAANAAIADVKRKEFGAGELSRWTNGYLQ